jgi:chemotaxis protein MotB
LKLLFIPLLSVLFLYSCVSSKKFKKSQADYALLQSQHTQLQGQNSQLQGDLTNCNAEKTALNREKAGLQNDIANLNNQVEFLKKNNTQALKQLEDMSVITSTQAESIKKSMENIGAKDSYIQTFATADGKKGFIEYGACHELKGRSVISMIRTSILK